MQARQTNDPTRFRTVSMFCLFVVKMVQLLVPNYKLAVWGSGKGFSVNTVYKVGVRIFICTPQPIRPEGNCRRLCPSVRPSIHLSVGSLPELVRKITRID